MMGAGRRSKAIDEAGTIQPKAARLRVFRKRARQRAAHEVTLQVLPGGGCTVGRQAAQPAQKSEGGRRAATRRRGRKNRVAGGSRREPEEESNPAGKWGRLQRGFSPVGGEVVGGAGGGGKGAGGGAVEAVADAEAVADELVDARDGAAGVGALRAEENQRGVRLGRRARVGALVGEFAGEMDVVGLGPEVQFDAEGEEVGGGFAAAFGADHFPDAGERGGGHGGAGKSRKGGGRGRETRGRGPRDCCVAALLARTTAPYSSSGAEAGRFFLALAPRVLRSSTWARRLPGPVFSLPRAPS